MWSYHEHEDMFPRDAQGICTNNTPFISKRLLKILILKAFDYYFITYSHHYSETFLFR